MVNDLLKNVSHGDSDQIHLQAERSMFCIIRQARMADTIYKEEMNILSNMTIVITRERESQRIGNSMDHSWFLNSVQYANLIFKSALYSSNIYLFCSHMLM